MRSMVKNTVKNSRTILEAIGKRGVERNFVKLDQYQIAPNEALSDYVLLEGYRNLINELENEPQSNIKENLIVEIARFEVELTRRNLLDESHSA
jgi:hypothetical protein